MRCFFAIEFDEETRLFLARIQSALRDSGIRGNYTNPTNFHLTLKFIGEVNPANLPGLELVLKKVASKHNPLVLEFGELGKFSRGRRPIIWCGLRTNNILLDLQKDLVKELAAEFLQFSGYERYIPHITLVREAVLKGAPSQGDHNKAAEGNPLDDLLKNVQRSDHRVMARGISLMESTRRDGRLVYLRKSFHDLKDK